MNKIINFTPEQQKVLTQKYKYNNKNMVALDVITNEITNNSVVNLDHKVVVQGISTKLKITLTETDTVLDKLIQGPNAVLNFYDNEKGKRVVPTENFWKVTGIKVNLTTPNFIKR